MDLGFETIGNAILICHDRGPVLVTDPWIEGDAYFGSWTFSHEIPAEQMEAIHGSSYVFVSHGHPDHLSGKSLKLLKDKKILLADHVGGWIAEGLKARGYDVQVLPDRKWVPLSERIRVLAVADYNQDSFLLADVGGTLLMDLNDANDRGWAGFVRRVARDYERSFLLKLSGYGDADMINIYDEQGSLIPPRAESNNGRARREEELRAYFRQYLKRAPFEFLRHRLEERAKGVLRDLVPMDSPLYRAAKRVNRALRGG